MVFTYSERDGKTTEESYFIMNFFDPVLFVYAKIKHWAIENRLHHPLDCVFDKDHCRVRTGSGHENLNILRKYALSFYRKAINHIITILLVDCKKLEECTAERPDTLTV